MNLFQIILRLIRKLNLSDTEEYNQLTTDVKSWESQCTKDSEDKMKLLYYKLHKGVFFRLASPIIFYFILRKFRNLENPRVEDENPFAQPNY